MEPTNQGEVPQGVAKLSQVIQIDAGKIQEHLGEVVRSTVKETLNAMLDAEADRLCRAERYERTEARKGTRAGSYERHLQTQAAEVTLKVPKLRTLPFETAIIAAGDGKVPRLVKIRVAMLCCDMTKRSEKAWIKWRRLAFTAFIAAGMFGLALASYSPIQRCGRWRY
jgi:transposase-like protein